MSRNTAFAQGHTYQADLEPITAHVAAQSHNETGGSSFYAQGGERAKDGYSVGGAPDSKGARVPEQDHLRGAMTPNQYQAHRDRVRHATTAGNVMAGTWRRDDGANVTDASNNIPDLDDAKRIGSERNEDAIYDVANQREIPL